jgi:hypothetical protein
MGGAKIFGVFRVKNHDFTPKNHIFSNLRGAGAGCALPGSPMLDHFTKLPKLTYTRPEEADVTSLLNSICNFDFVVTIVIVQMCLAFKKGLSRSPDLD